MSIPEFLSHVIVPQVAVEREPAYYAYYYEVLAKARKDRENR